MSVGRPCIFSIMSLLICRGHYLLTRKLSEGKVYSCIFEKLEQFSPSGSPTAWLRVAAPHIFVGHMYVRVHCHYPRFTGEENEAYFPDPDQSRSA